MSELTPAEESNFLCFSVQTRQDLCNWIERKLGAPLITVELTKDMLDDSIDEAVEEFTKYVNQERAYLSLDLTTYDEVSGFTLPKNVTSVFTLQGSCSSSGNGMMGGINTLFSIGNQMNQGGNWDNFGTGGGSAESWITYEAAAQYIDMVKRMTASEFRFEYNNRTKQLTLIPNPAKQNITRGHVVFGVNTIRPNSQQYGESWIKRYALALSKITLGIVRAKFEGVQLLGGGTLDTSIKDEGITERDELKEQLREEEGFFYTWYVGG